MLLPRKINSSDHGSNISSRKRLGARVVIIIPRLAEQRENRAACVPIRNSRDVSVPRTRIHAYELQGVYTSVYTWMREREICTMRTT